MDNPMVAADPKRLAERCENFSEGAKRLYEGSAGDMWLFELYHHLRACATSLRHQGERDRQAGTENLALLQQANLHSLVEVCIEEIERVARRNAPGNNPIWTQAAETMRAECIDAIRARTDIILKAGAIRRVSEAAAMRKASELCAAGKYEEAAAALGLRPAQPTSGGRQSLRAR